MIILINKINNFNKLNKFKNNLLKNYLMKNQKVKKIKIVQKMITLNIIKKKNLKMIILSISKIKLNIIILLLKK